MNPYLNSHIGRLRLLAFFEGLSLLILVFIAVPLKYLWASPLLAIVVGPIHGVLFLLFVLAAIVTSISQRWSFTHTTWKVLLACIVPFGTFYIDAKILRKDFDDLQKS